MMELWESSVKRSDKVAWRGMEDDCILLHLDTGFYYTLNEVGRFLWESCDGKKKLRTIHEELLESYDVDPETAKKDVLEITEDLVKEGLVEPYEELQIDPSIVRS
jgi:hypothetical protein